MTAAAQMQSDTEERRMKQLVVLTCLLCVAFTQVRHASLRLLSVASILRIPEKL